MTLSRGNPMARALLVMLVCAVIVYGLSLPVMLVIQKVPAPVAWGSVGVVCALALLGAATLRRGFGYYAAWLSQVGGVLLGLLTPMMWPVGGLLLALWVGAFTLGKRLEPPA